MTLDLERLKYLRTFFIEGGCPGKRGYWRDMADLDAYDRSFAQRIKWKWLSVFEELEARGFLDGGRIGSVHDFGCGSGIAIRTLLESLWGGSVKRVHLSDHSALACQYAANKLKSVAGFLGTVSTTKQEKSENYDLLLVSHVGNELDDSARKALFKEILRAKHVIWVDAGTPKAFESLSWVRERALASGYRAVAPCVGQGGCPIKPGGRDWCHQHGVVPSEVHTDSFWGKFQRDMNISVRSLPLSFIVLSEEKSPPLPAKDGVIVGPISKNKVGHMAWICDGKALHKQIIKLPEEGWSIVTK